MHPDKTSRTRTFGSRLQAIWRHVRKSIETFENTPDKGLIGKSFQRVFNRIWNYFIKGFLGSVALTIVFPLLCFLISTLSIFVAFLIPLW